jgi:transcriptional regulator with XRE-family HTH domain
MMEVMGMNERKISELLYVLRLEKDVGQKKLCWGLCSQGTYCRYENGERTPDRLLLNAIVQRLGKSADKLVTILTIKEYRYFLWKKKVLTAVGHEDIDELERLLGEKEASDLTINKNLQLQFKYRMQALVAWHKEEDIEKGISLLEQAVELTMPNIRFEKMERYYISIEEMHILLELARFWIKGDRVDEATDLLNDIVDYSDRSYDDYEAKVKILPKAVRMLYPLLIQKNRELEGLLLCKKAVELLCWQGVLYDLADLMEGYLECAANLFENEEMIRYKRQLQALREVYEEYGADIYQQKEMRLTYHNQELYLIDEMMQRFRNKKGVSQDVLSEGICTPETISRIESGRRGPNPNNFYALMRKLETEHDYYNGKLETNDFLLLEKLEELERAMSLRDWIEARRLLDYLKSKVDMEKKQNQETLIAMENCILFYEKKITSKEFVERCERDIGCENEGWKNEDFWRLHFFTNHKITMLNHIALGYEYMGYPEKCRYILEHVMEQLDKSKVRLEDRYESSITVVGNLSILYGKSGNMEECLMMCEKGIEVCLESGRGAKLVKFIVNKAEAMDSDVNVINTVKSKKYLQQAYYISDLLSLHSISAYIDQYYRTNYEQDIIWY